ncbi:MAG: hypothetical protein AAB368_06580 [bacterium]
MPSQEAATAGCQAPAGTTADITWQQELRCPAGHGESFSSS